MSDAERVSGLAAAKHAIAAKQVVVMPTDTVYGIAADAFSPQAVATLLAAKGRGRSMPPPVLIPRPATMDGLATDISADARRLAQAFWPGGLTLILHAQPTLTWDLGETFGTVALRMPDDEIALDLLTVTGPLAVSSANRTGQPAAGTAAEARSQLGESVEVYLEAGQRPANSGPAQPSTIVDATTDVLKVVRQGAISLAQLRDVVPSVLGVGEDAAEDSAADDAEDAAEDDAADDAEDVAADAAATDENVASGGGATAVDAEHEAGASDDASGAGNDTATGGATAVIAGTTDAPAPGQMSSSEGGPNDLARTPEA
jgi:L-threonylcarbamoyladenylate synthase